MERKLLLSIAMLLLFAFNTMAEAPEDLPALPINSSIEVVEQNDGEQVSFWRKILNFLGFSKEKKKDIAEKEAAIEETSINDKENTIGDIPEFDSSKLQIKRINENDASITEDTENFDSEKANYDNKNSNLQGSKTLAIPKGFEEDGPLKLPEGITELIESVEKESEKNSKDDNNNQSVETSEKKLTQQEVETVSKDNASTPKVDSNQKTRDLNDLKLPDGFDDILNEDFKQPETPKLENPTQGSEKNEEENNIPLESTNKLDSLHAADNPPTDNSSDVATKDLISPADEVQSLDKPVAKLPENNVEIENNSIPDTTLPVPDYASATDNSQKTESRIEKFTKNFANKKSGNIELPKITEQDYKTNEKGEIKKESAEMDSTQLQFVNNETQVLILPNDDVVLGKLTEHAKIHEMDLYSYIKLFWENYERLKREPQREVIERFIEEYDENFN